MAQPIKAVAVGIAWYTRETYPRCLAIFHDAKDCHDTFDKWLAEAKQVEMHLRDQGIRIERIKINPDTFPAWCAVNGFSRIDAKARAEYCSRQTEMLHNR